MHTSAKANRGLDEVFGSLAQSKKIFICSLFASTEKNSSIYSIILYL